MSIQEKGIRQALARDQFELHYQPIVEAGTSHPVAAEALLRWRNPELHTSKSGDVAAAAEDSEAIFPLDVWSIGQAFKDAMTWNRAGVARMKLNLNVSAQEFKDSDMVEMLLGALKKTGFEGSMLNLEVTESSMIDEPGVALKLFNRLKKKGIAIWLDDFGTGHSSLSWLRHFPVDGLKIPATFIKELTTDRKDQVIVGAVLSMAHSLELVTIAEGIEHEDQAEMLRDLGCDMMQGFLFWKPQAVEGMCRDVLGMRK